MEKKQYIIKKGIISSLKPEIKIPNNIKSYLPVATFIFISTWVVCGLYQGFSPTIALKQFNISNHIISAIIFSS